MFEDSRRERNPCPPKGRVDQNAERYKNLGVLVDKSLGVATDSSAGRSFFASR